MQTQPAVRVGFELETDGIQIYVFANYDKTSLADSRRGQTAADADRLQQTRAD